MRSSRPAAVAGLGLAVALAGGWLSSLATRPPRPLGLDAPPQVFSAARAARVLEEIARQPRPLGSPAHDRAREDLRARLDALGLETSVEQAVVLHEREGRLLAARLANLTARLPGHGTPGAVLLMAHYDTVPGSPGAGDDGSGVAAVLETLRALAAGPRLERDVVALFTDGEEAGLLGARAFAAAPGRLDDIALALNFEARGNRGPVLMFEAAAGSHPLVEELARAAPRPIASSLADEVYRRMPNDTDFSVLREAGVAGLNFAMIGGHASYHSRLDTVERLDLGSLQHHGSYALALARRFGDLEELPVAGSEGVFFNAFGGHLFFSYSSNTARVLAPLHVLLAALGLTVRSRRHHGRVAGVGWGLLLFVAAAAAGLASATLLWRLVVFLAPVTLRTPHGVPWSATWLALAGGLLTLALVSFLVRLLSGRAESADLWAGALLAWTLLGLVMAFFLPGVSYLFLWPPLPGWLALLLMERLASSRRRRVAVAVVAGLPGALILGPVVGLFLAAMTVRQAGPALALLALGATLFTVPVAALVAWARSWFGVALATAAGSVLAVAIVPAAPSAQRPAVNHLLYALDVDRQRALWLSADEAPDPWTAGFLAPGGPAAEAPEPFGFLEGDLLRGEAPALELPAPRLAVERPSEGGPHLLLRVSSARQAQVLHLRLTAEEPFELVRLAGREPPAGVAAARAAGATELDVAFFAPPQEGIELEIRPGAGKLAVRLADQTYGFPDLGRGVPHRPLDRIPVPDWTTDSTFVVRQLQLDRVEIALAAAVSGGVGDV